MRKVSATKRQKTVGKSVKQHGGTLRHEFYQGVANVLRNARRKACRAVNFAMVEAYWNIGRMIVEEEQRGKARAEYGKALIRSLSERLTSEFGAGFGVTNLAYFKQFYLTSPIFHTLCGKSSRNPDDTAESVSGAAPWHFLTWSHLKLLLRVEKPEARDYYAREAVEQNWSVRALERQINSKETNASSPPGISCISPPNRNWPRRLRGRKP